jgi:hypothetical protein
MKYLYIIEMKISMEYFYSYTCIDWYTFLIIEILDQRTMSVNERESPPRVSSMGHFFLERGPNPKNLCCLGQSSIS